MSGLVSPTSSPRARVCGAWRENKVVGIREQRANNKRAVARDEGAVAGHLPGVQVAMPRGLEC
jgi:hypothetical protein